MNKVISFSLWGSDVKYCLGAIRNAELAKQIYPDWKCLFYCGNNVPEGVLTNLRILDCDIIHMPYADWTGMFWRFYPVADDAVDVMISRDCDSRLNEREKAAVDEWLESDKQFHIMRDHVFHKTEILGGLFGVKKGVLPEMRMLLNDYSKENRYQIDQDFLRRADLSINKGQSNGS